MKTFIQWNLRSFLATLGTQSVGCYTEVVYLLTQWNIVVTLETQPVGRYTGGLLIQWNLYIVVTLETQPVGCYTEVVCLYSGTCIEWCLYSGTSFLRYNQLAVIVCYTEVACLYREPVYIYLWNKSQLVTIQRKSAFSLLIHWKQHKTVILRTCTTNWQSPHTQGQML